MESALENILAEEILEPILLLVQSGNGKIWIHTWDENKVKIGEVDGDSFDPALRICEQSVWNKYRTDDAIRPILRSQYTCLKNPDDAVKKWVFDHNTLDADRNAVIISYTCQEPTTIVIPKN